MKILFIIFVTLTSIFSAHTALAGNAVAGKVRAVLCATCYGVNGMAGIMQIQAVDLAAEDINNFAAHFSSLKD